MKIGWTIAIVIAAIIVWLVLSAVFYKSFFKRFYDIVLCLMALLFFWWLYAALYFIVRKKIGKPVIFRQVRPGRKKNGKEKLFCMYKYRSMTEERDENGELLPDEERLIPFGKFLRDKSIDELPELLNILKGDMSIVGPRPQLVHDMVFMTDEQRQRHNVRPGLTGLAQVSGRNAMEWDVKLQMDLDYVKHISFLNDIIIILQTVNRVIFHKGVEWDETEIKEDYGEFLLGKGAISQEAFDRKQEEAQELLKEFYGKR